MSEWYFKNIFKVEKNLFEVGTIVPPPQSNGSTFTIALLQLHSQNVGTKKSSKRI